MSLKIPDSSHLTNSRRNRVDLTSSSDAAMRLATYLADELVGKRARRLTAVQFADMIHTMKLLLLDLLSAEETSHGLWIGYSRGKANYVTGGCYWDSGAQRPLISYSHYLSCVDFLAETGLVESRKAESGRGKFASRIRTAKPLVRYFRDFRLNWTNIETDQETPAIVVKDENKRIVPWPEPGRFDLDQAIANLRRINENLNSTFINLNISDDELAQINECREGTPDDDEGDADYVSPIDFSRRTLKRVFAKSSFANGGRFYGGWWQGVPSAYRKYIEIDGAVTVELDYSTIQPRILYASVGQAPPEDSYVLPDWGKEHRKVVKKAFSQLLNSDATSRNPNQWHRFAPAEDPDPLPVAWSSIGSYERDILRRRSFLERTGRDYSELIADLLNYHKPIERDFFSGVWGTTQNIDSQIVEKVLIKLLEEPVPLTALPIHDSFIIRRGGEQQLLRIMTEVFNEVVKTEAKIDRDTAVFNPPPDYDGSPIVVFDSEFHELVKTNIRTHTKYHLREHQWIQTWGTID